jgi:transcriptional regulator with XRE-family HTH domain
MDPLPLNELLRGGRSRLGLTQGRLAGEIKTTQKPHGLWVTYISQIERGEKVPSDEVCLQLARVLELDPVDVLLAAQEARTQVEPARALIRNARILSQATPGSGLDQPPPDASPAVDDPQLQNALADEDFVRALEACYASADRQRVLELLERLTRLDDAQWQLFENFLSAFAADQPTD